MRVERDVMVTITAIGAILLIALVALWMPYERRRSELASQLATARQTVVANVSIETTIEEHQGYVDDLKAELAANDRYVPQGVNLGDLLRRISREVSAQAVVDHETQTLPIIRSEHYRAMPVVLKFEGSFAAAYGLIDSIETMPRLVRVTGLNIDGDPTKPDALLHIRLEMAAFFTGEEVSQ